MPAARVAISTGTSTALSLPLSTGSISAGIAVALSTWLATTLLAGLHQRLKNKPGISGFLKGLSGRGGRSYYGMWLAHIGIAVFVIGVTFVTQFEIEKDARLTPGQSIELSGYRFRFEGDLAVELLDDRQRRALECRYALGCSNEEGARQLEVSPATYKRLLSQAQAELKRLLIPKGEST